jgi:hypothetical protein
LIQKLATAQLKDNFFFTLHRSKSARMDGLALTEEIWELFPLRLA